MRPLMLCRCDKCWEKLTAYVDAQEKRIQELEKLVIPDGGKPTVVEWNPHREVVDGPGSNVVNIWDKPKESLLKHLPALLERAKRRIKEKK